MTANTDTNTEIPAEPPTEQEAQAQVNAEERAVYPGLHRLKYTHIEDIGRKLVEMTSEALVDAKKVHRKSLPWSHGDEVQVCLYPEPVVLDWGQTQELRRITRNGSRPIIRVFSLVEIYYDKDIFKKDFDTFCRKYLQVLAKKLAEKIDEEVRKVARTSIDPNSVTFATVEQKPDHERQKFRRRTSHYYRSTEDEGCFVHLSTEMYRAHAFWDREVTSDAGTTILRVDAAFLVVDEFREGFLP